MEPSQNGRGDFFAVDRRIWANVCRLNINAMASYLVMARGTGRDQRTTSWSVNAIEKYTGIGRSRARKAVEQLVDARLVGITNTSTIRNGRMIWDDLPASLVLPKKARPHCRLAAAHEVPGCEGYTPAKCSKSQVAFGTEAAAEPDWIWLPNDIIDGAAGETAAVELVRQTQNAAALRLLVDLYHDHALADDGGIHWRSIR